MTLFERLVVRLLLLIAGAVLAQMEITREDVRMPEREMSSLAATLVEIRGDFDRARNS